DASGNVYLCDANNDRIRKITSAGVVTTLAGSAIPGGNIDGDVSVAGFHYPLGLCADFTNNYLFIVDYFNHRIRRVNLN
ncbi:MAG: hypothetical protein ABI685_13550, partial [Ferruginibacter sp.]